MSGQGDDPFERRDMRPILGKTDRRDSLRTEVDVRVHVGEEVIETKGNVSLEGFLIPPELPGSDLVEGSEVKLEILIPEHGRTPDDPEVLVLPATVSPTPGDRPGCYLSFPGLDFEKERALARLLDLTHA